MRVARLAPALLVILALQLASCDDSGVTAPAGQLPPRVAEVNAPPTSGPHVQRGVPLAFIVGPDPNTGLTLEAGFTDPITSKNCTHLGDFLGVLTQQQVSTPSGREQFTTPSQDVVVFVYDASQVPGVDVCELAGVPLVATGTATVEWGEKNVPPPGLLGPGAGTVHITVHGVLDLTSGGQVRVQSSVHVLFKDGALVHDREDVTLSPF